MSCLVLDPSDGATSNRWARSTLNQLSYVGPDHSTFKGASGLCRRLEEYWAAKGITKQFEPYLVGRKFEHAVYGVRIATTKPPKPEKNQARLRHLTPEIAVKLTEIVNEVLATQFPGIDFQEIRDRYRGGIIGGARNACMIAAHNAGICGYVGLGKFFNRDHSTVVNAVARAKAKAAK